MALDDNLIHYYELEEAADNDATDAHGSVDLTETATVNSSTGKVGNARNWDSGADYFQSTNSDFNFQDTDFSFSLWIKTVDTNYRVLVSLDSETYALYQNGSNINWMMNAGTAVVSHAISTVTWHHVVATHDATANEIALIVDDGTPSTTSFSGGPNTGTTFSVGESYGSIYFYGDMDELGVWDKVLSASEITSLYNSGDGLSYSDITGGGATGGQYNRFIHQLIGSS